MNSNVYVYTYQHTCKNAVEAFILRNAPFRASRRKEHGKTLIPFLGEGYYLWEENVDAAKRWGQKHYKNDYTIVEYKDLQLKAADFLDLTDRRQLKYFNELQETYILKRPDAAKWKIGQWIEFFKLRRETDNEFFPFNYIKSDEHLPDMDENNSVRKKTYYIDGLPYYTYLSPLYMLCVIDKSQMTFETKTIIT